MEKTPEARRLARALADVRRAIEALARGDVSEREGIPPFARARDRAYRAHRFIGTPASLATIETACQGLQLAIESGYSIRQARHAAEIARLTAEIRADKRAIPY